MPALQVPIEDQVAQSLAAGRLFGGAAEPARVGRFVVLRLLGRGGMGVVFSAFDEDLDRRVALKVLRKELSQAPDARARMLREAQALARLSHPHVVQVHEVGECQEQIFIAMEYVHGQTLRTWLKEPGRTWAEIVAMFVQAGLGLAAAHEKGLIHRDFKPENVLIGDDGRARVVDFGLAFRTGAASQLGDTAEVSSDGSGAASASAIDRGPTLSGERLTVTGATLGTPSYMSPEQHLGRTTDARTDQFSFCVALYEGLYGTAPFVAQDDDLGVRVCRGDVEPPPRSRKVPRRIHEALIRGLAPDPSRRWPEMNALLAELARVPTSPARLWLLSGAVALALGVVGSVMMKDDAPRLCAGGREQIAEVWSPERERSIGETFAAMPSPHASDTWARASAALGRYSDAWVAMHNETCEATHVRGEQSGEALDLRMACLERRKREFQALIEVFAGADASVLEHAVQAASNLPSLVPCAEVETLKATLPLPEEPERRAATERVRASIARARALGEAGRMREGLVIAQQAAQEARSVDYAPLTAEALLRLGRLQEQLDVEAAEGSLYAALRAGAEGKHDAVTAQALIYLVHVVGALKHQYELGIALGRTAEAAVIRAGDAPLDRADLDNILGIVSFLHGDFERSRLHHQRSMELRIAELGAEHPAVARSRINLGAVYSKQARFVEAAAQQELAVALAEEAYGPDHPLVASGLTNLGIVRDKEGRQAEAVAHHRRALRIMEATFGADHGRTTPQRTNLALALTKLGQLDEAAEHLERALAIKERMYGPDSMDVTYPLNSLATVRTRQGDHAEARRLLERAITITERSGSPELASELINLAELDRIEGHLREADDRLERAGGLHEQSLGRDHPDVAGVLCTRSEVRRLEGDHAAALQMAERALSIYEAAPGGPHPDTPRALVQAAEALLGLGQAARARYHLERALAMLEARGAAPDELADVQFPLARSLPSTDVAATARAARLAAAARTAYAAAGRARRDDLARVQRWLDARPSAPLR